MRIYIAGRQTGKTTNLIAWIGEDPNRVLIVHSMFEAYRLHRDYPDLEDQIIPISLVEKSLRGKRDVEVAIDNLDLILPQLIMARIGPVTYTGDFTYGT